jgi:hypothetical protein
MGNIKQSFWSRAARQPSGCLEWTGAKNERGYGIYYKSGHLLRAHRVAWEMENGAIPAGVIVLHRCDNPPCIDTRHLSLGTQRDNMADMVSKMRAPNGEKSGTHKLSEAEALLIIDALACKTESRAALAARFRVSATCIQAIATGKSWKHLPRHRRAA